MNKLPYCEAICRETHRGVTKESNCKNYARHTWLGKPVCKVHLNHYLWLSKKALDSWEIGGEKTRHEIISMARKAGFAGTASEFYMKALERFADFVAAAEREECAEICDRFQARDVGMQPAECAGAIRARGKK